MSYTRPDRRCPEPPLDPPADREPVECPICGAFVDGRWQDCEGCAGDEEIGDEE